MRTVIAAAAILAAGLGVATAKEAPTDGQSGGAQPFAGYYAGFGAGFTFLQEDEVTYRATYTNFPPQEGPAIIDDKGGAAASLLVGRQLSRRLSVEGELGVYGRGWDGFDNAEIDFLCDADFGERCEDPALRTVALTANAVVSAPEIGPFRPYAGLGAGLKSTGFNIDGADRSAGIGVLAKAGMDVAFRGRGRLGFQVSYITAPDTDIEFKADFGSIRYSVDPASIAAQVMLRSGF